MVLGFGLGWAWPGLMNFAVVRLHPQAPAAATSITQTGVYAGGCLGPLALGAVAAHLGYPTMWAVAAASMLVAATLMLTGSRLLEDVPENGRLFVEIFIAVGVAAVHQNDPWVVSRFLQQGPGESDMGFGEVRATAPSAQHDMDVWIASRSHDAGLPHGVYSQESMRMGGRRHGVERPLKTAIG